LVNAAEQSGKECGICRAFETLHRHHFLSYNYTRENLNRGSKRRTSVVCDRVNGMLTVMHRTLL
jgi:hypothetical protein